MINTGEKFFGKKLYFETFGKALIDSAFKTVFHDHYNNTAPLEMRREDVQILLKSQQQSKEQMELF